MELVSRIGEEDMGVTSQLNKIKQV